MSVKITVTFNVNGTLTNPTSVKLADAANLYGVKRADTGAVVVASGVSMTNVSTGVYSYTFTEPASDLTYTYAVAAVIGGVTYRSTGAVAHESSTVSLSTRMDNAIESVTGAPLALIRQQEAWFFEDFCKRSEVWRHRQYALTVEDQAEYAIVPPTNTAMTRFIKATIGTWEPDIYPILPNDESITFVNAMSQNDESMEIEYVVAPINGRDTAPTWLMNRYWQGMVDGVLGYLYGMAGRPWFNAQLAVKHMDQYEHAIAMARGEQIDMRRTMATVVIPRGVF